MSNSRLITYRKKRDIRRTSEPAGNETDRSNENHRFVIQKHDAKTLHYDLRIEVDGVLKSWIVPKGPSTDPSEKRLAIPAEDHPLEYIDFEATIPEGEYGAGTVLVWDTGTYRNPKEDTISQQIDNGQVELWLEGEKISGGYALISFDADADEERWLLVKMDDDEADARRNPVSTEPESVLSGKYLDDIAQQRS